MQITDAERLAAVREVIPDEKIAEFLNNGVTIDELYWGIAYLQERGNKAKRAADFGDDETRFVWNPYIPRADFTVLMADGGTGKTILCCGIAAAISRGERLPGDKSDEEQPQNVLIISAEDKGELLKRRLVASGADLQRVFIIDCMDSAGMNFTDGYDEFSETVKQCNPALVIVDPWHAFLGAWHAFLGADVDINRVNAVRPIFQQFAVLAKERDCGLVLVSQVNKRAQSENANFAAVGTVDFINAARSALRVVFSDEPAEKNVRVLVHTKSNYSAAGQSLKFEITADGGCEWRAFPK